MALIYISLFYVNGLCIRHYVWLFVTYAASRSTSWGI